MNPSVFFVGCARSGTTLLYRLADAHPLMAITPELHWITDYFREGRWLGPRGVVTPDQVASMLENNKRFRQFKFTHREFEGLLVDGEPVPYVIFLNRLFGLYGRKRRKSLVGNKTPAFVRRIPVLHSLWPSAKFVHLIRDGRDVCLSVLDWNHADRAAGRYSTWANDPVMTTALWWKRKVRLGRQGGQPLAAGLYCEMRYEDLVNCPATQCARMCAFLDVRYDAAMLRFHEGRMRTKPGLDAKRAWLPVTPGLRDWRAQMAPADVERFEAAAGDLLEELGYPRACARPSPRVLEQAHQVQDAFTADLRAREDMVPELW